MCVNCPQWNEIGMSGLEMERKSNCTTDHFRSLLAREQLAHVQGIKRRVLERVLFYF